jgi:adenine-specific DNA-methyltransferase
MTREPKSGKKLIEPYDHKDKKRVNNPPVGLVSPELDREKGVKAYAYDPHLDPQLQWSGMASIPNLMLLSYFQVGRACIKRLD